MENLLKQVRVRFSGQENTEEPGSTRQRRTPSFRKEENKAPQNWFRRQFSGQMNQDNDSNTIEQATAVAAAAYAITSLNASPSNPEGKKISKASFKSKRQVDIKGPETDRKEETTEESKEKATGDNRVAAAVPQLKRTLTFTDKPTPSMKKAPTFAGASLSRSNAVKIDSVEPEMNMPTTKQKSKVALKPDQLPTIKPPPKIERQITARPGMEETKADAWERAELSKIQKRYEETNARIHSWENKKKEKAKRRLKNTESDLEQIRSKTLKQFHDEMVDIGQISGGAKAKAAERRRNDELKAKEKANTIRKTGELPKTCFCF